MLSRICRWQKHFDGSRSCREFIEKKSRNLDGLRLRSSIEKRRNKGSIEMNLSRICQEAIELEENEFFKEEKHKEMNATSKLLKHKTNQHIKLSKYLSTYMKSIQDPKHTHTH